jgi:PAS domain S-box-containing protein
LEFDPAGQCIYANQEVRRLTGLAANQVLGDGWLQALQEEEGDKVRQTWREAIAKGEAWSSEFSLLTDSGMVSWVQGAAVALRDEQGAITGYLGYLVDITDSKKADRVKSEFISTVSHELRTPLTSIKGALGLIQGGTFGKLPEAIRPMVEMAYNNCDHLVQLINDLLDVEKIEAGKMDFRFAALDVEQLVRQAITINRSYGAAKNVRLVLAELPPRVMVRGDRTRLLQVMANLLSNAIKFSPPDSPVEISVAVSGKTVRVSVTDHGEGVPEEFRDKIFQKFSQADSSDSRQEGGTGLGLSICRAIIERHDGRIDFHSETGKGSSFYFDLPVI